MANYNCTIISNYFRVKDEDTYKELMSKVSGDDMYLYTEERNGEIYHFFGSYGTIYGIEIEDEDEDYDYDIFIENLQRCVHDEDAIIIQEVGHEKMRYVAALATIITSKDIKILDLGNLALDVAKDMLNL